MSSTYFPSGDGVDKKWYAIDASEQTLGRLSSYVAKVLMGKHKPQFTKHADTGDFVVIFNAEKVKLTGNKLEDKFYRNYSGYPGGLKEVNAGEMLKKHPERVIMHAVKGMLPKNKVGSKMISKLKVYAGEDHPHAAQQPFQIQVGQKV